MSTPGDTRYGRLLRNVKVPMRDGVGLATTALLPPGDGPFPAVLIRTAYNRTNYGDTSYPASGLALVIQDTRGRYDSGGEHYPFTSETADGLDTLAWLRQQPWCNGKIGMVGASYLAATQFLLAPAAGNQLHALSPQFMAGDCWKHAYYVDGAFSLALTWSWLGFECAHRTSEAAQMPQFDVANLLRHLPILDLDERSGGGRVQSWRDYVRQNRHGPLWEAINFRRSLGQVAAPMLLVGGWYDNYAAETTANYLALRAQAPSPVLRDSHRLLIGPWSHGFSAGPVLGQLGFGPEMAKETDCSFRWLTCLLRGGTPSEFQRAPIRIFVMGDNRWRDEYEWPLARTRVTPYYLRAGGGLSAEPPGAESPDHYRYDPADPVPTLGGNHSVGPYNPGLYDFVRPGPYDQSPVEARPDVLSYTSAPLAADTEITGPVVVKLYAASSARDTDFAAKLTDVHPDGRSMNITEGVIRARFRQDVWGVPNLIEPGRVYEYTIDLQVTSNVFRRGHCLRVDVTSSNFPLWDRNLNTGNDPATDTEMQPARQTIHHDRARPSHILLPVIPD